MIRKYIDARGDACPIPVVKTKNAMKDLQEDAIIEIMVDNEIAVQNLSKMAGQKGYPVSSEKLEDRVYKVMVEIVENSEDESASGTSPETSMKDRLSPQDMQDDILYQYSHKKKNIVVVLSSATMGDGEEALGSILMKGFIYALSGQEELPSTILLYNGGAKLSCEDAPTLEDLKELEAAGVEILTCGTCLNHYGLSQQLKVGSVTNMYVIAEKMMAADLIVKP